MCPQGHQWHQWLKTGQGQSISQLPWKCSQNFTSLKVPWMDDSPTSLGRWSREKLPYTSAERSWTALQCPWKTLWNPKYSAAGLYPGSESELHLASAQSGHVSSFLGPNSNIQRPHLSHINLSALEEQEERHHIVQITLQFLKLYHLRHLHLEFLLLKGCLDQRGPLQCSRLENPRDGGAWWAAVYGVAQSWTRLKRRSSRSSSRPERASEGWQTETSITENQPIWSHGPQPCLTQWK